MVAAVEEEEVMVVDKIGAIKDMERTETMAKTMGVVMMAMGAGTIITAADMEATVDMTTQTMATMVNTLTGIKLTIRWRSVVPYNWSS